MKSYFNYPSVRKHLLFEFEQPTSVTSRQPVPLNSLLLLLGSANSMLHSLRSLFRYLEFIVDSLTKALLLGSVGMGSINKHFECE